MPSCGKLTVTDLSVTADSLILVNWVGSSRGSTINVDWQGAGSVRFEGTANKKFRYIVFN
jgi:hypothetical protein